MKKILKFCGPECTRIKGFLLIPTDVIIINMRFKHIVQKYAPRIEKARNLYPKTEQKKAIPPEIFFCESVPPQKKK